MRITCTPHLTILSLQGCPLGGAASLSWDKPALSQSSRRGSSPKQASKIAYGKGVALPPDGAGACNVMDIGTRPKNVLNATQAHFVRACGSHPAMLFHYFSFPLAKGTGLLHIEDMGTDVGEKMQEEVPTNGIAPVLSAMSRALPRPLPMP